MTAETKARLARIAEVMGEIADDCEKDATGLDGRPFDARNVAEVFGSTLAMVHAVAQAVKALAEYAEQDAV